MLRNTRHTERGLLEAAGHNPHSVIDTPLGKVGLLICWDLACKYSTINRNYSDILHKAIVPEAFRALITQGANIIIIPTFCKTPIAILFITTARAAFLNADYDSKGH